MNQTPNYSPENIKIYSLKEAVRLRPGMYVGSLEQVGLANMIEGLITATIEIFNKQTLFFEIVFFKDNSFSIRIIPEIFNPSFEEHFFIDRTMDYFDYYELYIISPLCKEFVFQSFNQENFKEIQTKQGDKIQEINGKNDSE